MYRLIFRGLVSSFFNKTPKGKWEAKHFKKCKNERIKIIFVVLEKKALGIFRFLTVLFF